MRIHSASFRALALCTALGLAGAATASAAPAAPPKAAAEHEHAEHGPHGGELLELGDEEYHAEIVHDEKAKVLSIYLLDSSAKKAVAVPAKEMVINLKHDGKPEQHKLAAAPQAGDPAGSASRFWSKDADLQEDLEKHGVDARLQVVIGGKSYTAKIVHHHHEAEKKTGK